ncbi:uncharacterized protein [Canis lupus baileyi]|uniref:uncharacterized protein n=1 Tax=Canis lupus baileyi TaxID=143281 RepID=UPI003B976259
MAQRVACSQAYLLLTAAATDLTQQVAQFPPHAFHERDPEYGGDWVQGVEQGEEGPSPEHRTGLRPGLLLAALQQEGAETTFSGSKPRGGFFSFLGWEGGRRGPGSSSCGAALVPGLGSPVLLRREGSAVSSSGANRLEAKAPSPGEKPGRRERGAELRGRSPRGGGPRPCGPGRADGAAPPRPRPLSPRFPPRSYFGNRNSAVWVEEGKPRAWRQTGQGRRRRMGDAEQSSSRPGSLELGAEARSQGPRGRHLKEQLLCKPQVSGSQTAGRTFCFGAEASCVFNSGRGLHMHTSHTGLSKFVFLTHWKPHSSEKIHLACWGLLSRNVSRTAASTLPHSASCLPVGWCDLPREKRHPDSGCWGWGLCVGQREAGLPTGQGSSPIP